jgi:hypothetical protein
MDFSGFGANAHVFVFCSSDDLAGIRTALKPLLGYFGGVGFVSEAEAL